MSHSASEVATRKVTADDPVPAPRGWRLVVGSILIALNMGSIFCIPLVNASGLPEAWKTTLSGLLVVGIPQVFLLLALAVLGKSGVKFIMSKVTAALSLLLPSVREVSPARHRIGVVMFVLPLIMLVVGGYLDEPVLQIFAIDERHGATVFDFMFLASFFVLGGDFWDKLCALFVREARVC